MAWIGKTQEEIREYDRQYRAANKERINQQDRNYWHIKYETEGRYIDEPLVPKIASKIFGVVGQRPSAGEKAIYFLRNEEGKPYYVGSTSQPAQRWNQHRKTGRTGELVIVRCCPTGKEVYWESKLLVELTEMGFELENLITPASRNRK